MPEPLKLGNDMAKYLLDTCVCISMFRNEGRVRETLLKVGIKNCYISEITVAALTNFCTLRLFSS